MYKILKRSLDIVCALVALLMLIPIFVPVIIILSLTGEREVFYLQNRVGYNKEPFKIWKFATMLKNSEKMGTGSITVRNDPRVTKFGHILRITKINELPQIINVLIGNMSIVGPRPLMRVDFEKYSPELQEEIVKCKPGITGIGSIVFRDEQQLVSETEMDPQQYYLEQIIPYKGLLEIWYSNQQSLFVDIKIIFLTAWVILFSKSELHYSVFKKLPQRPKSLKFEKSKPI